MDQMIWANPLRFENQPARREHDRASETDERTLRRRNRNISNPPPPSSPSHIPASTNCRPRRRLLSTGDIFDNMRGGPSKAYRRDIMGEKERNAELAKLACEAGRNEPAGGQGKDTSAPTLRGLLRRASIGIKNRPHTRRPSHSTSEEQPAESYVTSSRQTTSASATWHKLKNAASFTSTANTYTIDEKSPNLDKRFEYSSDERSIHPAYAASILDSAHSITNLRTEPHPGQHIDIDPSIPLPGRGQLPPYIPTRNGGGAAARATAAAQNEVLAQVRRLTMHELDSSSLDWESGVEMGASLTPVDSFRASPRSSTNSGVSGRRSRCKVERIDFTSYLPNEISAHIFGLLDAQTLTRCELVSRKWRNIVLTPAIWRDSLFYHKSTTFSLGRSLHPNEGLGLPKKESTQDWKQLYRAKTQVETNWKAGHCKASYLNGHTDSVYCLQFDEHKILTGSRDRTIRIWDLHTHCCLAIIASPNFEFNRNGIDNWTSERPVIPTTPNGQRLQRGQATGPGIPGDEERVTSISTLAPSVYKHTIHHDASILCLQYDAQILVTGSSDHTAIIHDMTPPYTPIARLSAHRSAVLDVAFDEEHIVTASKDNAIQVYTRPRLLPNGSWSEAKLVTTLSGHTAPVNSVQINGSSIVSCSGDFSVKLWNLTTGTCVREFEGHRKGLACSQFSADGRYIASAGNDKVIRVWDARTGQCLREQAAHDGLVRCLFWDNTSGRLISGSYDQDILLWDMKDGKGNGGEGMRRDGESKGIRKQVEWNGWHGSWVLAAKGDWRRMVSAGQDRRVLVCDFGDGVRGVEHLESAGVDADGKECRGGKVGRYDGEDFKKIDGKRAYGGKE